MTLIRTKVGKIFEQLAGVSILESASSAGVCVPYSCRTGRCGSCRCKVVSGESDVIGEELGLTDSEKSEGWILSCVRSASSDLNIEFDDLSGYALPSPQLMPCRINNLHRLSEDVVSVFLRLPPKNTWVYLPGQYIDLVGPGGVRRSYSIASFQRELNQIELQVRLVRNGAMSDYLFNSAKSNDLLRFYGPLGTFFLRELSGRHLIFLATGTGIAPIKAMLESLAVEKCGAESSPKSVSLYWGGRTLKDLYLDSADFFVDRYAPVLSQADTVWPGKTGYVQDAVIGDGVCLDEAVVYACGSDAMIKSARKLLCDQGLPSHAFYSDAFVASGSLV